MPLVRFLLVDGGIESVDERRVVVRVGPADEFRFNAVGREDFRSAATLANSGWLLFACRESRRGGFSSRGGGNSDNGIVANKPEFRYSFPTGDSRFCT